MKYNKKSDDEYFTKLEALLYDIALIYGQIDKTDNDQR
jgi:hypothetical protein